VVQKGDEVNPTKKGLMMNPEEWAILEAALPSLQAALASQDTSFVVNMSGTRRATIFEKGNLSVDIREWYSADDGSLKPGQKGVALSEEAFQVRYCSILNASELDVCCLQLAVAQPGLCFQCCNLALKHHENVQCGKCLYMVYVSSIHPFVRVHALHSNS
jgi:hypothetical protein